MYRTLPSLYISRAEWCMYMCRILVSFDFVTRLPAYLLQEDERTAGTIFKRRCHGFADGTSRITLNHCVSPVQPFFVCGSTSPLAIFFLFAKILCTQSWLTPPKYKDQTTPSTTELSPMNLSALEIIQNLSSCYLQDCACRPDISSVNEMYAKRSETIPRWRFVNECVSLAYLDEAVAYHCCSLNCFVKISK